MTQPLRPGDPKQVGSYDVRHRLGEGGQAVVYLGHGPDGETVAIKVMKALRGDSRVRAEAAQRFVKEVEAAKRVARFCTAQVIDVGMLGERPYIISEYIDAPSLRRLVVGRGPRSGAVLERLAVGTATALVAIHRAGVVHRDFTPHNVLLAADGPRVIDFGIARSLDAGASGGPNPGTPAYMAPEQLGDGDVTPATDVYAWAATMVFAATGRPPFEAPSLVALLSAILQNEPDLAEVPEPLREVVAAGLAKDPARRPTAQQIVDRLMNLGNPRPAEPVRPAESWTEPHPLSGELPMSAPGRAQSAEFRAGPPAPPVAVPPAPSAAPAPGLPGPGGAAPSWEYPVAGRADDPLSGDLPVAGEGKPSWEYPVSGGAAGEPPPGGGGAPWWETPAAGEPVGADRPAPAGDDPSWEYPATGGGGAAPPSGDAPSWEYPAAGAPAAGASSSGETPSWGRPAGGGRGRTQGAPAEPPAVDDPSWEYPARGAEPAGERRPAPDKAAADFWGEGRPGAAGRSGGRRRAGGRRGMGVREWGIVAAAGLATFLVTLLALFLLAP